MDVNYKTLAFSHHDPAYSVVVSEKKTDDVQRWKPALPNQGRDVMLSARVPEPLRVRTRKYSLDQRTTLQEIVIAALDEYLKARKA